MSILQTRSLFNSKLNKKDQIMMAGHSISSKQSSKCIDELSAHHKAILDGRFFKWKISKQEDHNYLEGA